MRYYIHIPLPEDLKNKIMAIRSQYPCNISLEPHITVINPRELSPKITQPELCNKLRIVLSGIIRFPIVSQGMGGFPNLGFFGDKDVIYIGIRKTIDLLFLQSLLSKAVKGVLEPSTSKFTNYNFNPHITLLEGLKGDVKLRAWNELKDRVFFDKFICEKITLLSKIKSGEPWTVVDNFPLS